MSPLLHRAIPFVSLRPRHCLGAKGKQALLRSMMTFGVRDGLSFFFPGWSDLGGHLVRDVNSGPSGRFDKPPTLT